MKPQVCFPEEGRERPDTFHRGGGHAAEEAPREGCGSKPRNTGCHQSWERQGTGLPYSLRRAWGHDGTLVSVQGYGFQISDLPNGERIRFCRFQPLSFVVISYGSTGNIPPT